MDDTAERSARDDLALIRNMMEAGRRKAAFDGTHLTIWGVILTVAYFAQYLQIYGHIPGGSLWIWLPAFALGWVLSFRHGRQSCAEDAGPNLAVTAYNGAWLGVGITMLLYFLTGVLFGSFNPKIITVLASGIIASAFFTMSLVTEMKALKLVAAGWWLIMIYASVLEDYDPEILLVLGASSALLILLPGQLMARMAKHSRESKQA